MRQREIFWGFLFLSPWIIGFILFGLIPLGTSFYFSLLDFSLLKPDETQFVGLANYRRMIADPIVWRSMTLTATYVAIWTPLAVLFPLGIATLLHGRYLFGKGAFRFLFYLPTLVPDIAVAYIFGGFFFGRGWFYKLVMEPLGISLTDDPQLIQAIFNTMLVSASLWGVGNIILILLAAQQGVPKSLYEAAEIDGAGFICKFKSITLPMISPVIFYSVVISLIGAFQFFAAPYLAAGGGADPDNPAMYFTIYISRNLSLLQDVGYAATLSWLLTIFVAVVAGLVFWTSQRWVFYADA